MKKLIGFCHYCKLRSKIFSYNNQGNWSKHQWQFIVSGVVVFAKGDPVKKTLEQGQGITTNSRYLWDWVCQWNPGHSNIIFKSASEPSGPQGTRAYPDLWSMKLLWVFLLPLYGSKVTLKHFFRSPILLLGSETFLKGKKVT